MKAPKVTIEAVSSAVLSNNPHCHVMCDGHTLYRGSDFCFAMEIFESRAGRQLTAQERRTLDADAQRLTYSKWVNTTRISA